MGKTVGGAVWLDPEKTSPFDFFQYWRNVDDADVMKCLKMLTFLSLDEIAEMEAWPDNRINEKKEILAYELTALVHGKEEAEKAKKVSHSLFGGGGDDADMPTTEISVSNLTDGQINMMDLMMKCGLVKTKSEARRLIMQNGVSVDSVKINMNTVMISEAQLKDGIVIKKGKKVYHKAILAE